MRRALTVGAIALGLAGTFQGLSPVAAAAQEAGARTQSTEVVVLPTEARATIREYYASHGPEKVKPLPPGIRKNLARGKPLPPGIAKRAAPADLHSRVQIPSGYELMEVGLDVVLVEVATQVIHEVLMDVIR
jgi:hypothetical protein